jgi:hypothetical protein
MIKETKIPIKNRFAAYGYSNNRLRGMASVIKKDSDGNVWIKPYEYNNASPWVPEYVKTFDNPLKMMAYFLVHQYFNPPFTKEDVIRLFLDQFPDEHENLERILLNNHFRKQTKPKCTEERIRVHELMDFYEMG